MIPFDAACGLIEAACFLAFGEVFAEMMTGNLLLFCFYVGTGHPIFQHAVYLIALGAIRDVVTKFMNSTQDSKTATEALAKAIKAIDPLYGHRAYAFAYSSQNQPELARKEYLDGIREQPDSPRSHGYYGQYLAAVEKNYPAAFAELVDRHQRRVHVLCWRLSGSAEESKDLAQETFLRVFSHRANYQPGKPFTAWLQRICVNVCLTHNARLRQGLFAGPRPGAPTARAPSTGGFLDKDARS